MTGKPRHWSFLLLTAVCFACSDKSDPNSPPDDEPDPPPAPTFLSAQEIIDEMTLAASSFPEIAQVVNLTDQYQTPSTHRGRSLYAIKISDNPQVEEDEPAFLMVSAHHGNEIGTPVVALYAISRLTEGYGTDPTITELVNEHEIWIAPVWNPDGYPDSRKNGRPGGGVDLNRNYPFLWDSDCSGSTDPTSGSFKGASPGSEPETQTMMAFSEDQRFAKVLDYHSSGRETLFGYRCNQHHLDSYLENEAVALSQASTYLGASRRPSADGEHYQWQLGNFANYAFLTEISNTQSPAYSDALAEAIRLWPGTRWMLQKPIPVWGHVRDADTGDPLSVQITYLENPFTQGEENTSEPEHGRFHAFLPEGTHTLRFSLPGYVSQELPVTVSETSLQLEVSLVREPANRS